MRGTPVRQATMLSAMTPEDFVPAGHPVRTTTPIVEAVLKELNPVFSGMYAAIGRLSVPPGHLLKGQLLIALFSIRSERQLCERLQSDMMFRWFTGP